MDIQQLLGLYTSRPSVVTVRSGLENPMPGKWHLKGLAASSDALVASALYSITQPVHVLVLSDRESAAYFLNDLENILGGNQVLFFPASYKNIRNTQEPDNSSILMRAEVLSRINRGQRTLVVTFPEAFAEKVVTRHNLELNSVEVRVGENLSTEFLNEFLLHHDFNNVDFVAQAGEYSVRGGIIDIYSFANELPYRIEFSGDAVESIRTFEPESQLSVQSMNHITIIPNVQTRLLEESRTSFLDFIPGSSVIWFKDLEMACDQIQEIHQLAHIGEGDASPENEWYDPVTSILERLEKFHVVEFGNRKFFKTAETVEFGISPQPSFNKNFELLIRDLQKNSQEGYSNILFSDSGKQIERLYAIFEDLEKKDKAGNKVAFSTLPVSLHGGFIDRDIKLACYTDHQIFDRYHRYRLKKNYSRSEALTIKDLSSLKPGDFVTHIDHGIGRFAGLEMIDVNGKPQEAVRLIYKDNDILYVSIHSLHRIAKYSGKDGTVPVLHKLGSNAWSNLKQKTKKKVKDIAKDLITLYAKRKATQGFAFAPDTYLQNELEASFIYEDTPDQVKSTRDVKRDMEKAYPMDRLICGDVGFGKTEVAIRAAFKAVSDSRQVAVLVPTTILALQHYNTFRERLKGFPCSIDYINRFKSARHQKETLTKLEEGKIDIIIGTHRLLGKDVVFKNLGLIIVDEEQKFGVASKEKLKAMRVNVDTLTLTATPIPRTLQFSLMGARDLSIINTPPPNRVPVVTELHTFNETVIRDAINFEVSRGGQVFFVHNRIQDIHEMAAMMEKLLPDIRIAVGHGQMDGDRLEEMLINFIDGEYDVLVATTIIESGLDIPNANTIIINQAQHFGLSDLHQMRGRVGRSNKRAFCYLLAPPMTVLTNEARQRLRAIEEFSDLGSGFNVAMRDLDIRGAGNLLGGEQSGFISEIGFEMYHKILDEALQELKETQFSELFRDEIKELKFVSDCQIDTDLEILLPSDYINSVTERLALYKELDSIDEEENLQKFVSKLRDRFGPLPVQARELMSTIRLRWHAEKLGFEKILLKNQRFIGYFVSNPVSPFYQSEVFSEILKFVKSHPHQCRLKEDKMKLSLSLKDIKSVEDANKILEKLAGLEPVTVSEN